MKKIIILALALVLLGTACSANTPAPTAQPATATAVPQPTLTPTPVRPLTVLLIPADYPQEASNQYQSVIYELAQAAGMRFQVRNHFDLSEAQNEPGLQVVVALPPAEGLAEMAAALPDVRFLALGVPDLEPAENLFVLGGNDQIDFQGFMAGYIAALITMDYRVGLILPKDNASAEKALDAFRNGMTYYCGLCRPAAPPWYEYPIYVEIPEDTPEAGYSVYADALIDRQVGVVFVHPDVASPLLLSYLNEYDVGIISTMTPDDDYRDAWVASIQPDLFASIQSSWETVLSGQNGQLLPSPVTITDLNDAWVSEGRQRLVEETFEDLKNGRLVTQYHTP